MQKSIADPTNNQQLSLDDAFKVKGPDRWEGNTYVHYGRKYGIQVMPPIGGISTVRHIKVNNDTDIPAIQEDN